MDNVISFLMDARSSKALNELRTELRASSNAEVVRRALTLLHLAVDTVESDGHIILRNKDGRECEVVMS